MASVRPLTDLTVADLWKEVKDPAWVPALPGTVLGGAAMVASAIRCGRPRNSANRLGFRWPAVDPSGARVESRNHRWVTTEVILRVSIAGFAERLYSVTVP